jgi:hypothetical protein
MCSYLRLYLHQWDLWFISFTQILTPKICMIFQIRRHLNCRYKTALETYILSKMMCDHVSLSILHSLEILLKLMKVCRLFIIIPCVFVLAIYTIQLSTCFVIVNTWSGDVIILRDNLYLPLTTPLMPLTTPTRLTLAWPRYIFGYLRKLCIRNHVGFRFLTD